MYVAYKCIPCITYSPSSSVFVIIGFRQPLHFSIELYILLQTKFLRIHFKIFHKHAMREVIRPFLRYRKVGKTHRRFACIGNCVAVHRTQIRSNLIRVVPSSTEPRLSLEACRLQACIEATLNGGQSSDTTADYRDLFSHHYYKCNSLFYAKRDIWNVQR